MTTKFKVPTKEKMNEILKVAKETGNYKDIVIAEDLKISFFKTHENYTKCGLDMVCDEGEGEGATLHFTKREILDEKWNEILYDRLLECNHYFNDEEIKQIKYISNSAIKHGKTERSGEEMTLKQLVNELYFHAKAYSEAEKTEGDAFVRIKLWKIPKLENQECICINSAALDEFLDEIGVSSWKKLKLKKELRQRKISVTNQGLTYDYRIQTDEARRINKSMKFVVIPLKNLEGWLDIEEGESKAIDCEDKNE